MLDQLGNGLLLGIIISVASVALSLLYGVTRIVNFAHGEIIALGAIMTLFFSSPVDYRVLFLDKYSPLGYNFALSCILAVIVCGLFGALLEICLFSTFKKGQCWKYCCTGCNNWTLNIYKTSVSFVCNRKGTRFSA